MNLPPKEEVKEINSQVDKSPFRPGAILNYLVSRGPRIIGWNDDVFRAVIHKARQEKLREEEGAPGQIDSTGRPDLRITEKSSENVETDSVGIMDMASNALIKKMLGPNPKTVQSSNVEDIDKKVWLSKMDEGLKDLELYKHLLTAARYQRDAYIMGAHHAELRKSERAAEMTAVRESEIKRLTEFDGEESDEFFITKQEPLPSSQLTYRELLGKYPNLEQSTLGFQQLSNISQWFIPSQTMHKSLLPTMIWTVSTPNQYYTNGGPLYRQVSRSVINLIPLSQTIVDSAVKNSVLYVLRDHNIKGWVKGATNGYVSNMQRDAEDENMTGKFVTTKIINST